MPNRGLAVSSPEYSRVNWLLNVVTRLVPKTWTLHLVRVDKLSRLKYSGYPISVGEVTTDATGITTLKKFVYTGWGSKKQTYITGSTIESEFMALAAAGKEAEWLKNLLLEIPLHLRVRHSMIRELITNGVVSIEFVRSQQNLADHLTKGLARDLVIKSAEGMGLNSN
ncbi:hypothetical protein Tco_0768982 [Tanacetum coccineum]|uniref:Polyprotein n=1 Tax=Tanacetum coccineum TaxID=301880 RepID=A0ABQ4Z9D5_9ASTR